MPDSFFDRIIDFILKFRGAAGEILSPLLPYFKAAAFALISFFIFGTVYSIIKSNWLNYWADEMVDAYKVGDLGKRRILRAWYEILRHIKSPDQGNWKRAIIEADKMLGELLRLSGYKGETVHERLNQVSPAALPNIEELKAAHGVRDQIVHNPHLAVSRAEAVRLIRIYGMAFRAFGLID